MVSERNIRLFWLIPFLSFGDLLGKGIKGHPGGAQTKANPHKDHPGTQIKAVLQPKCQRNTQQGGRYQGKAKLGDPVKLVQDLQRLFHATIPFCIFTLL